MTRRDFYVYLHRRVSDNQIFYVGKGSNLRSSSSVGRNSWWKRVVKKHGFTHEILAGELSEVCAFSIEKIYIQHFRCLGFPLVNLADGGLGASGVESHKRKTVYSSCGLSFKHAGDAEGFLRISGYALAHRQKITQAANGVRLSAYDRSWSYIGTPPPPLATGPAAGHLYHKIPIGQRQSRVIYSSLGERFSNTRVATQFLRLNGYPKASWGNIGSCARGEVNSAYDRGWAYDAPPDHPSSVGIDGRAQMQKKPIVNSSGQRFASASDAIAWLKENGYPRAHGSFIAGCCKGKFPTAYGFVWNYSQ